MKNNKISIIKNPEGKYSVTYSTNPEIESIPKDVYNLPNYLELSSAITSQHELWKEGFFLNAEVEILGLTKEEENPTRSLLNILREATLVCKSYKYMAEMDD